jgi:hypothetical protein
LATAAIERHLLFGLLAPQNGLIDQDQLVAAFHAWSRNKPQSLADHLVNLGHLGAAQRSVVEALAAQHVAAHGGEVGKSLAAIPAAPSTGRGLSGVAAADFAASLAALAPGGYEWTQDRTPEPILSHSCVTLTRTEGDDGVTLSPAAEVPLDRAARRYEFLGQIDRGGMCAVLKARDPALGRDLAPKILLDRHRERTDLVDRFVEEARICCQFQHPGVVPVYKLGTFGDRRPYFTMKLVKARTLAELLRERMKDEGGRMNRASEWCPLDPPITVRTGREERRDRRQAFENPRAISAGRGRYRAAAP